jgi:asparagine synthase (glutamine-hydrolysing)
MCGIAGIHGKSEDDLDPLLVNMRHRGPDGKAVVKFDGGSFGHVRLAIVDVEGGEQPIVNEANGHWLVCNGEIYNHQMLRDQLPDYDYQTESDSEVILALYERYGVDSVNHLDGMFAFALWDGTSLYMARDPLGIKPLYYGWNNGALHFASEIKVLQGQVDEVHEFPHGHWYHTEHGFQPYYNVASVIAGAHHAETPTFERIRETLSEAVRKRLMSDVPLGVFLSGGLDSSIVAAVVAGEMDHLHSFNVSIEGKGEDRHYARMVSDYLGTEHHEYIYTLDEMIDILPTVIFHLESYDPSIIRSAIPNYFLAKLASEYVTVVLSGEGADELMSGYHYLKDFTTPEALQQELVRITDGLHDCNLQRLDRMTMAHSLEGRVPFLDTQFIALAATVDLNQRLHPDTGIEKWALRKAFEGYLPDEVIWRKKSQFAEGAGSAETLVDVAEREISDAAYAVEKERFEAETDRELSGKEELYYYRIFRRYFDPQVAALIRRWMD